MPVVCPVFYAETLADLGKEPTSREREATHLRDVDSETLADIAPTYKVSRSTISRLTG